MMTMFASMLLFAVAADTPAVRPLAAGDTLPELRGEFLNGKPAILPQAAAGRPALLLLGFTYDSRIAVEAWAARFREQYKSAGDRVTFFEVPMIGGMARMGKWFIDSGMRKGTPKQDWEHVITVYGGVAPWKARTAFQDPKAAYLVLIDGAGKVAWMHRDSGFDEKALAALRSAVDGLLHPTR
jgi:hypothetical protein